MPHAFIFDLDGTILDTLDDIGTACNLALENRGFPTHPLEAYRQMVGNGFSVLMQRALGAVPLEQDDFLSLLEEAKEMYSKHMCERTKPYPGLVEALRSLARKDPLLCVLSNKPEPFTKALVAHYFPDIPFVEVLGGRKDQPMKPNPARAQAILRKHSCDAAQSLFIGDSNVDMQTALAAGMIPIGVAWGFRGALELEKYGATKLLQHPSQLADLA